jgi:murein DD-endopeptidase MepM/ murein hydrolase activator NlpD
VAGALLTTASAAQADHGSDLRHRQHQAQQQVHSDQHDLDGASRQLLAARAAVVVAQRKLNGARAHLQDVDVRLQAAQKVDQQLEASLTAHRAELAQAQADLSAGQQAVSDQETAARRAILSTVGGGNPQLLQAQALLDGTSLDDVAAQQAYGAALTQLQLNTLQSVQAAEVMDSVHHQDVSRATASVAVAESAAAKKVAEIQQLRAEAVAARDALARAVGEHQADVRTATRIKQHDATILARDKKREAHIHQQLLHWATHDTNRTVGSTHGMFLPPVANTYITSPFGWRIHPIYGYEDFHDGDDLHAPCGTPEVAVAHGKVMEEYYSDVWGHRLFLDLGKVNGHSYVAIYNHIEAYRSHVGEVVTRGQTLALAGTTGWSTACHLHITIMRDGTAVDPAPLIGM